MNAPFPAMSDLKAGRPLAWSAAFSFLWPMAVRVAQRVSGDLTRPEAEEVASDAIRSAIDQIDCTETEQDLRALVAVIARRRAVSLLREKFAIKRAPGGALVKSAEENTETGADQAADPSQSTMDAETLVLLGEALGELDAYSRQLLYDKYVEGFSYQELSRQYHVSVGTLCSQALRAVHKVRSVLERKPKLMKELSGILR